MANCPTSRSDTNGYGAAVQKPPTKRQALASAAPASAPASTTPESATESAPESAPTSIPTLTPTCNSPSGSVAAVGPQAESKAEFHPPSQLQPPTPLAKPVRRRGTVACGRCRRLRSKCVHDHPAPPCQTCKLVGGLVEAQCSFPKRGEKDVDRQFRRRTTAANTVQRTEAKKGTAPAAAPESVVSPSSDTNTEKAVSISTQNDGLYSSAVTPVSYACSPPPRPPAAAALISRFPDPPGPSDARSLLPPIDEVVEGCRIFVTSYFQLGFIPKSIFLERLIRPSENVSTFLLCCILCISARFTPKLVQRYGGARKATDYFVEASRRMVPTEMYLPSLERIQAFFLLAISQWGNGDKDRSSMDMGIAVRMAALLKLHSEESYALPPHAPAERIVQSESARRTFWMIQSQENLHSGYKTPAPFPLEDITTLLPCDEKDFAFGDLPTERAAMAGTPPGLANPSLVYSPRRCLFATLIQVHGLWGKVARRACRTDHSINKAPPWDASSEYARTITELNEWEASLPQDHCFSVWNLRGWKSESLHLAYLAVTMVIRLSHIVSRRIYLEDMLTTLTSSPPDQNLPGSTPSMAPDADEPVPNIPTTSTRETYPDAPGGFWAQMATELFTNVQSLHEQIDAFFSMRTPEEGFPQILVFCVYMCGSLASYLWRSPSLCPELAPRAETMANRALEVLSELHPAWPMSSKWQKGLQQIATPLNGKSPAEGPSQNQTPLPLERRPGGASDCEPNTCKGAGTVFHFPVRHQQQPQFHGPAANPQYQHLTSNPHVQQSYEPHSSHPHIQGMHSFPNELFDAELTAFLQGDFQFESFDSA
ncbi:hypothetical protein Cpir12675_005897 [Ceratocystis pirilliformis]|uniref:Zn(2)-C6 fungal-type domain-containing protein n=1 Tax=Ceratocystis pirilliformis TaxID=259994 RepID=A0ABR3YP58_9PEZI